MHKFSYNLLSSEIKIRKAAEAWKIKKPTLVYAHISTLPAPQWNFQCKIFLFLIFKFLLFVIDQRIISRTWRRYFQKLKSQLNIFDAVLNQCAFPWTAKKPQLRLLFCFVFHLIFILFLSSFSVFVVYDFE